MTTSLSFLIVFAKFFFITVNIFSYWWISVFYLQDPEAAKGLYFINYIPSQSKPSAWVVLNNQYKFIHLIEG